MKRACFNDDFKKSNKNPVKSFLKKIEKKLAK